MSETKIKVLTIGHSSLSIEAFLSLLKSAGASAVADVRSTPFSRRFPHFSRDQLNVSLRECGITYVFLGKELGGRPRSSNFYCDGVADYEKMALETAFLQGLDRIVDGSNRYNIVLMCSERDPLDCHRCLLVGRALSEKGVLIGHILNSGRIAENSEIEDRLLRLSGNEGSDMFLSRQERLARSYKNRARNVAYKEHSVGGGVVEAFEAGEQNNEC